MVQMFYYENRGKCCKKLLRYNGYPNKVRQFAIAALLPCFARKFDSLCPFEDFTLNLFVTKFV